MGGTVITTRRHAAKMAQNIIEYYAKQGQVAEVQVVQSCHGMSWTPKLIGLTEAPVKTESKG